ncbi:MAG: hypothetical protein JXB62_21190 [Pirellulales bacterium]|nr:hypothetical protein [Pirellulales bacterium]
MNALQRRLIVLALMAGLSRCGETAEWHVATDGKPDGQGTLEAPWDLASALAGKPQITAGDTVWIGEGTYKHPDRRLDSPGYVVKLVGKEDHPIRVRGEPGGRVTIDGGLSVQPPSTWLRIRDLEILVSENATMPRRVDEPGSHPQGYGRPWGGLHIHAGEGCKYIHLIIHDNAQGVSWWRGSTDSELYGCILYDNGWDAPDRGHGHAVYTQNESGIKTIADCMMTGGCGYTIHAYGSSQAYVDNYLVEGNICYDGGRFLIGGGRPSRHIRVLGNLVYNLDVQLGYSAPYNEDCEARGNVVFRGGLQINNYRRVIEEGNTVIGKHDPPPEHADARVEIRPSRYDPNRAHVAVFNWTRQPTVELPTSPFLNSGDQYTVLRPREFFGEPVAAGTFEGEIIRVPVDAEFAAFVLLRKPSNSAAFK